MHDKLIIGKKSIQKYDVRTFIVDSVAMSHMVTMEENKTNLRDTETQVTIGDSRVLTVKNVVIVMAIRNMT